MRTPTVKGPVDCDEFHRWIFHFQANEVPEDGRASLQEHLDHCPDCARRLEFEDSFLSALKSRLPRAPAPPGLETRILAGLGGTRDVERTSWHWLRSPGFAALAASALLAAVLFPGVGTIGWSSAVRVERDALVVDLDCDAAGKTVVQQRNCRHPRHVNALKVGDGAYWNLVLEQDLARDLVLDPQMRGHLLHVEGEYFKAIRTLRLQRLDDLGEDAARRDTTVQGPVRPSGERLTPLLVAQPRP